jgi:glycosyltransferase involved in cell wall biosynthesis
MREAKEVCVAFLYAACWQKECKDFLAGAAPSHRLWGQIEMGRIGGKALVCPSFAGGRFGNRGWFLWQTLWLLWNQRSLHAVFAVHEVGAFPALVLRAIGLFRKPLVVLNFGLLHPKNARGFRKILWQNALRAAGGIISLVKGQIPEVARGFGVPEKCQFHIPLGVDLGFVGGGARPAGIGGVKGEAFLLAVGTNEGKDYPTLLEALPLGVRLVIVTDEYNERLIRAHRCFGEGVEVVTHVPIRRLRDLYREAAAVVIPLHDTPYGSGHTVFLENMAAGNLLVVSESRGMKGYARGGRNCLTVRVGDVADMRRALERALGGDKSLESIRQAAARDAAENFSMEQFATRVFEVLTGTLMEGSGRGMKGGERGKNSVFREEGRHATI